MSQFKFHAVDIPTRKNVEVIFGWDRLGNDFYFSVLDRDVKPDEEYVIEVILYNPSFETVYAKLAKRGIKIPEVETAKTLILKYEMNVVYLFNNGEWANS